MAAYSSAFSVVLAALGDTSINTTSVKSLAAISIQAYAMADAMMEARK